jgi:hypothetical protein
MERNCPHCEKALKLIAETEKTFKGKTITTEKFRCPVSGCGYTFTTTTEEE